MLDHILADNFFSYTTSRPFGEAVLFTISPQWYFTLITFGSLLTLYGILFGGKFLVPLLRWLLARIGIRAKRRPPRSHALPQSRPLFSHPSRDFSAIFCLIAGPLLLAAFFNHRGNTVIVHPDRFSIHTLHMLSSATEREFPYASIRNLDVEVKYHLRRSPTHTLVLQTADGEQRIPMSLELRAALPLIKERRLTHPAK